MSHDVATGTGERRTMKKLLLVIAVAVIAWLVYALAWPTRFAPVAWQPVPADTSTAKPASLAHVTRLAETAGTGPETVITGPNDALYAGYADGTVHRLARDANARITQDTVIADTNGRPLGLAFAPPGTPAARAGTLYIADADKGLVAVDEAPTRTAAANGLRLLTDTANGTPFRFTDDVVVADDGRLYFTDASSRWPQPDYRTVILEHAGDARLMVYDPATDTTRVLLDGLQFANGITLSRDQRYLLINETSAYRVRRYWLRGERAGTNDIFIDGLPGFPDGISRAPGADVYWIALFAPRNALLDFAADKPFLRRLTWHLPAALQPKAAHEGHILAVDDQGRIVANLIDKADSAYAPITSVEQVGDTLILGSLERAAIGRLAAPTLP